MTTRTATIVIDIICNAPESVFAPDWNDIPQEYQETIEQHNGIGCEGTGDISPWCIFPRECPFTDWDGDWDRWDENSYGEPEHLKLSQAVEGSDNA